MARATNNRLLTENNRKVQKESGFSNFWILLEADPGQSTSKLPRGAVRDINIHPLGKSRV